MSDKLTLIPRSAWRAERRGGPVERRAASSIRELFVHWPGAAGSYRNQINTIADERRIIRDIQRLHIHDRGWSDIGYNHILIPDYIGDGHTPRIYVARGAQYVPAAQLHHNSNTIAIMVLLGESDHPDTDTYARLRSYVRWADDYADHKLTVRGHGEVFGTECPGPDLRSWVRSGRHR